MRKCHDFVAFGGAVSLLRRSQPSAKYGRGGREMVRLILAGVLALGAAACAGGAGDERPAPTVMGDETDPSGTQPPGDYDSP